MAKWPVHVLVDHSVFFIENTIFLRKKETDKLVEKKQKTDIKAHTHHLSRGYTRIGGELGQGVD